MKSRRRLFTWLPITAATLAALAIAQRLTIRDHVPGIAALYYASPPIVPAIALLASGTWWLIGRRWVRGGVCIAAAAGCAVWWQGVAFQRNAPSAATDSTRIALWNIAYGSYGWEACAARLGALDADLIGLVESNGWPATNWRRFCSHLPDHRAQWPSNGLSVFSRGAAQPAAEGALPGGAFRVFEVELAGRRLHVVVVDFKSNPLVSKAARFAGLWAALRPYRSGPLIVMGDFNTPTDSVFFDGWRAELDETFEAAGRGYAGTWPVPLPLLPIDHIWVSRELQVLRCDLRAAWCSDHRMVVAEVRWRE